VPIRAGLLSERIRIERRIETKDMSGQVVLDWQIVATVWARVEPLGGRETFGQEQFVATGDVRFTMRRRDDVTPLHRIVHAGRVYDVVSVAPDGRDLTLVVGRARTEARR
jgi:SPP1 family predicted phage head-tail adaptor